MTNEEVLIKLIQMRYTGLTVPTEAMVTATMIDLEAATAEGRSVQEVAIAILEQSFFEDDRTPFPMRRIFQSPPSPRAAS